MNQSFEKLGFYPADILLPKDVDMTKWAVVACDQFTSQPEYWQAVEDTVGNAPSTLRLILPEAKLNDPDVEQSIADINSTMEQYLESGVFQTLSDSLLYMERAVLEWREEEAAQAWKGFCETFGIREDGKASARCADWILEKINTKT